MARLGFDGEGMLVGWVSGHGRAWSGVDRGRGCAGAVSVGAWQGLVGLRRAGGPCPDTHPDRKSPRTAPLINVTSLAQWEHRNSDNVS